MRPALSCLSEPRLRAEDEQTVLCLDLWERIALALQTICSMDADLPGWNAKPPPGAASTRRSTSVSYRHPEADRNQCDSASPIEKRTE